MRKVPRHWLLIARRNAGKSTFAAQMDPEYLVADLDGRWAEQEGRSQGKSHVVTESEPLKMVAKLETMRATLTGAVSTIIFDSGTAVMDFLGARARLMEAEAAAQKQKFNMDNANRQKADTLRVLRLAALKWQCDVLWIFHIEDGMLKGAARERTTISKLEMDRMKANLNAVLTIVEDKQGRRGIRIEWSRYHAGAAEGHVIWDDAGEWRGVPQLLDDFLAHYKGTEGFTGNVYSGEWLLEFLKGKGRQFADVHDMYIKLDVKDEPRWFDRNGWGALIAKATA